MTDPPQLTTTLVALIGALAQLDDLDAPIAAAHLDAAIEALCYRYGLERNSSDPAVTVAASTLSAPTNTP